MFFVCQIIHLNFAAGRKSPPGGLVLLLFQWPMSASDEAFLASARRALPRPGKLEAGKNSGKELRFKPFSADRSET
jgi:hypothetical protein